MIAASYLLHEVDLATADEGNQIDEIVEQLIEEHSGGVKLTRFRVGTLLKDYDMNSADNMRQVLARLAQQDVKVV